MDIKKLFNFPSVNPVQRPDRSAKLAKFDNAQERDGNGQEAYQQNHRKTNEPMSEEQFAQAIESLEKLPAVKEHNWTVEVEMMNEKRFVLIKDAEGKLIRRIPELDLWTLNEPHEPSKGQLLKKTA